MERSAVENLRKLSAPEFGGVTVGRIVRIDRNGQVIVDFPGNEAGPLAARSALHPDRLQLTPRGVGRLPVLLVFENCNPTLPIIIGCVQEPLETPMPENQAVFSTEAPRELAIDGHSVTFEASEEIVLRCGESSITLKKNGRVVVKGVDIVSRASRTNKVKGAAVMIN